MSALDYYIRPYLTLKSIVGVPLHLTNKMLLYYVDGTVMSTAMFNSLSYSDLIGCKVVNNQIVPTATSSSFRIASGHAQTLSFASRPSLQIPISISTIKTTIGVGNNNLSVLNSSGNINLNSPCRPKKTAPYSIGEWINYCHQTDSGVTIANYSIYVFGGGWMCACVLTQKDVLGYQYQAGQVKVDFFSTTRNTSIGSQIFDSFDYIQDVNLQSYVNCYGSNNIQCRVYLKDSSQNWVLSATADTTFVYAVPPTTYSIASILYNGMSVYLQLQIFNGDVDRTFDVKLTTTSYTGTSTCSTISAYTSSTPMFTFYVGHTLNQTTDLFTIQVKPTNSSTWTTLYDSVHFNQLPNSASM